MGAWCGRSRARGEAGCSSQSAVTVEMWEKKLCWGAGAGPHGWSSATRRSSQSPVTVEIWEKKLCWGAAASSVTGRSSHAARLLLPLLLPDCSVPAHTHVTHHYSKTNTFIYNAFPVLQRAWTHTHNNNH